MFDLSGIGGFMSGVTGLNWAPNIPTPSTGDYQNLNWLFNTTMGAQGLQGLPGANASISANYSGYVGGEGSYSINNQTPIYGTVYNKTPVYAYNSHAINPFCGPQLVMEETKTGSSHHEHEHGTTVDATSDVGINNDTWNTNIDGSKSTIDQTSSNGTQTHHRHHHRKGDHDGPRGAEQELETTDASGKKTEYTKNWCEIMKASDANKDGVLSGDELKNLKMYNDTHHDGTVHSDDFKSLADLNVAEVNLGNGSIITKDLAGYRTTASQQCIGYYGANIYGSSGGSSVGFNFTPTQPSTSVQENLTGLGSYDGGWGAGQYGNQGGFTAAGPSAWNTQYGSQGNWGTGQMGSQGWGGQYGNQGQMQMGMQANWGGGQMQMGMQANWGGQYGNQGVWEVGEGEHHGHGHEEVAEHHHGHHGEWESGQVDSDGDFDGSPEVATTTPTPATPEPTPVATPAPTPAPTAAPAAPAAPPTLAFSPNVAPNIMGGSTGGYQYTNSLGYAPGGNAYGGYLGATGWAVGAANVPPPMQQSYGNNWSQFRVGAAHV